MTARAIEWHTWDLQDDDDRRFYGWCGRVGLPALALALVIPFLEFVVLPADLGPDEGKRYAELLAERAPPPVEEPKPEKKEEVKKPELTQEQKLERARERANRLLKPLSELAKLAETTPDTTRVLTSRVASADQRAAFDPIAATATETSGGIGETAVVQRQASGIGLGERRTTAVQSAIGVGGGSGTRSGERGPAGRSFEEIQLVFDRNKGAFYTMYTREQRKQPNMQGKMVVRLTIAPSGRVLRCTVVSSDLNNPEFERKVVARVLLLDFGAKDVGEFTLDYPIFFFPA